MQLSSSEYEESVYADQVWIQRLGSLRALKMQEPEVFLAAEVFTIEESLDPDQTDCPLVTLERRFIHAIIFSSTTPRVGAL